MFLSDNQLQDTASYRGNITLKDITRDFGSDNPAVDNLDLEIKDRELLVLLGPSGCGKSTTLYMLAGLETPTRGEIYFGERLMNHVPPEARDISMVFQSFGLYPHLNARENIEFPLRMAKVPSDVIEERLSEVSKMLDIDQLLGRRLNELSGGERQRVAICKALVKRPSLFLLDEPFSSLDAEMRRQLRSELVRIHRQLETTMVFVTHDQEEAMAVADRVAVMRKGELIQIGEPLDMYNRPRNTWIARFVGAQPINFIDCTFDDENKRVLLFDTQDISSPVPDDFYRTFRSRTDASQVLLGIRPENVVVQPDSSTNAMFQAEVFTRQVLGNQMLYELNLGPERISAVVPSTKIFRPGAQVTIGFDWAHVLTFDKDTGMCLLD